MKNSNLSNRVLTAAGTLIMFASALIVGASTLQANDQTMFLADDVIANLNIMKTVYRAEYAPTAWKQKFADYDLDREYQNAIAAVKAKSQLNLKDAHRIFKKFVLAMKDYHTSISFIATEAASLPLAVKSVGRKVFIVYIDRTKLSKDAFHFQEGDELVTFDGRPTAEVIDQLQNENPANVNATDRALSEMALTSRRAAKGLDVPQGPVTLGIKNQKTNAINDVQLLWDYKPEKIKARGDLVSSASAFKSLNPSSNKNLRPNNDTKNPSRLLHPMMSFDFANENPGVSTSNSAAATEDSSQSENPFGLGSRKTFTPDLGAKIWESADDNEFYAYICMNEDRKLIGYLRLPSYIAEDYKKAVSDFAAIIERFEESTDAMIIDQVNNPGGSVFYLYTLASMLATQPLKTPLHRMSITQADVASALDMISKLEKIHNNEEAKAFFAENAADLDGYPASYEFVQFYLNYARFIVSEWDAGRKLSRPYWIGGVNHINPSKTHYTKPILVLINQLDFSGGDFFPGILQDNKRVTVMGMNTAGAGGYVNDIQVPNNVGINSFRCTESIAERVDGSPLENLGVTPDISYEMTDADYTSGFAPYTKAIGATISGLMK